VFTTKEQPAILPAIQPQQAPLRVFHFPSLGLTLGASPWVQGAHPSDFHPSETLPTEGEGRAMRVAFAWVHSKDQFSRARGRQIVSGRLALPVRGLHGEFSTDNQVWPLRLLKAIVAELRSVEVAPLDTELSLRFAPRFLVFPVGRQAELGPAPASEEASDG
jgi:hypothetical protein